MASAIEMEAIALLLELVRAAIATIIAADSKSATTELSDKRDIKNTNAEKRIKNATSAGPKLKTAEIESGIYAAEITSRKKVVVVEMMLLNALTMGTNIVCADKYALIKKSINN